MESLTVPIDSAERTIRLLQLTDCHIGPTTQETLLGLNTDESLHDVIDHVAKHQAPFDVLLATGDISNNGGARTFRRFLSLMDASPIRYNGFAWLPGNHDSPEDMNEALGTDSLIKQVHIGHWTFVLLNTQVPGHVHGNLPAAELDMLDELLGESADRHILVFMHHQPVPVGASWLDTQRVRSDYAFFKILDQYTNVKAVVWGHVHQDFAEERNGVKLMSTPSTCIQFKSGSEDFAIDKLMPGYRWFELFPDGHFTTQVQRITHKDYPIEFSSEGY